MEVDEEFFDIGLLDEDTEMCDDELQKELEIIAKEEEEEEYKNLNECAKVVSNDNGHCNKNSQKHKNTEYPCNSNENFKHKRKKQTGRGNCELHDGEGFSDGFVVRNSFTERINFKRLKMPLEVSKETDPYVTGREIAYRLQETKTKLFGQVVRVLGAKLSLEIFEETKRVMLRGGIKTDQGDRKRSPGGTFLYLMKSRGYASKRQMKEIFKIEEEKKKKFKKEKARLARVESQYKKDVVKAGENTDHSKEKVPK